MALIGKGAHEVDVKLFDDGTQDWPPDFTPDVYLVFSGQGFEFPEDQTWVNRSTGTEADGGMIEGFPRSAEVQPNQPGPKWYITES